jgi:hypothetical protein
LRAAVTFEKKPEQAIYRLLRVSAGDKKDAGSNAGISAMIKKRARSANWLQALSGGSGGIRTHEPR